MMGLYADKLFPWGLDKTMRKPAMEALRKEVLKNVLGRTLEIGFGTGLNLPHYPDHVSQLTTVDVCEGMNKYAQEKVDQSSINVELRVLNGELLPMADQIIDSVVSTWTLCSITNLDQALQEIRRVLKPDGQLIYLEHGLSPEPGIMKWQNRLNPIQKIIGCGCHLNRDIKQIIEKNGLTIVEHEQFYLEDEPKTHGYMYRGIAKPDK